MKTPIRKSAAAATVLAAVLMSAMEASAIAIDHYSHLDPHEIRVSGNQSVAAGDLVSPSGIDPFHGPYKVSDDQKAAWFYWDAFVDGLLELSTEGSILQTVHITQTALDIPLNTALIVCQNSYENQSEKKLMDGYRVLDYNDDETANKITSALSLIVEPGDRLFIGACARAVDTGTQLKLRHVFRRKLAELRFNAQGGSVTKLVQTVYDGDETLDTRGAFPDSLRGGFEFAGWFTQPEGGVRVYGSDSIDDVKAYYPTLDEDGELNLYAQWTVVEEPVAPKADASFSKTQRIYGRFETLSGTLIGSAEVQVGKKNSKNKSQLSVIITRYDTAKRIKGRGRLTFSDDGSAASDEINLNFKDSTLQNDTLTMIVNPDGTFSLAGSVYKMEGAQVGGALTSASLVFGVEMPGSADWPKPPTGYMLVRSALPNDFAFPLASSGRKFSLPKGKTPKYVKSKDASGQDCYVLDMGGEDNPNVSMLKLSYQHKTGLFKGTFTIYASSGPVVSYGPKPKFKKSKIQVVGLVIDGKGYGVASMKGTGQDWAVTLTP